MKPPDGNTRELVDRTGRSVKVQRVHQHASIGLLDLRNDFVCCDKVRDEGPGHKLKVRGQFVLRGSLAESCKVIREPAQIGIVCCYEDVFCAKSRTGGEERGERRNVRLWPKC